MKSLFSLKNILIGFIVFLAFFLRVYKISSIPPALSWDEVSIGYNAYSILTTGKDEHGRIFPLDTFVGYGDYKPPLSIYATIPFVALFGLNEFAVRLPSVIAGTLTVLVIFFLVKELFRRKDESSFDIWHSSFGIPATTSLLLAISPWHIQLSRAGFEGNIGTFFIVLGVWLLFACRRKIVLLPISVFPFVAAIYTFNSTRYVAPLLALGALFYIRKYIVRYPKVILASLIITIVLLLPILPHLLSRESRLRYIEVNIFSDPSIVQTSNERVSLDGNSFFSKIIHNRRIGYVRSYLVHFLDNFEPRFLFIRGDGNPKFSIQDVGQLYIADIPFLLLGVYFLFTEAAWLGWFLLFWFVVSIAPSAVARETPHALRTESSLPVFILMISYGLTGVFARIRKDRLNVVVMFVACGYILNFFYYIHNYYIHYPLEYSREWQYGYREAISFTQSHLDEYDHIYLTESIGRAYMYTLFYTRYDPREFWKSAKTTFDTAGFYHVYSFGKYNFVSEGIKSYKPNSLYILSPSELPSGARILQTIRLLNGDPALVVFTI